MNDFSNIQSIFELEKFELTAVSGHEGGRNLVYICRKDGENPYILRISATGDRTEEEYLAETEFVHYLAGNGAPVADVRPSKNGNLVERTFWAGKEVYVSLFDYAKGMLISDNGYRYRDGAPLYEYFFNTGKALGKIHRLSKDYHPEYRRSNYFDKYNMNYINSLRYCQEFFANLFLPLSFMG